MNPLPESAGATSLPKFTPPHSFGRILVASLLIVRASLGVSSSATFFVAQRNPKAGDNGPGSPAQPWKTIGAAAAKAKAGDTVFIGDGIYRELVRFTNNGTAEQPIRFEAQRGAHVLLTGADRLTNWRKPDPTRPVFAAPWNHRFLTWSSRMAHPDDDYHQVIGRCEQVAIQNYLLRQVLDASQLAPGTFFADVTNGVLEVWDVGSRDPNQLPVEASVREQVLVVQGAYVQVRGLQFRFAANSAQQGAVALAGNHDLLDDCVVESMNGSGASFTGEHHIVRHCVFRDNGQLGFGGAGAHDLLLTGCIIEDNNTKGFDRGWEAGGLKLVLTRDAVLEQSQFLRNRGSGIWFDIGNENCTVRRCLVADNEDAGIFYEISYGLRAHDNVIVGNGFADTPGAWGAQAGICLSSSPDCVVERNVLIANREGFDFREQTRTTPRIGKQKGEVPVWNHDELITHNIIAFNRDAQIWGWFDMKDNRHWPAAGNGNSAGQTPKQLAELRLKFVDNVYWAGLDQSRFEWGVTWARHRSYGNLREFQSELQLDHGGAEFDPEFADPIARDFRVSPDLMEKLKQQYPSAPVPNVTLGLKANGN